MGARELEGILYDDQSPSVIIQSPFHTRPSREDAFTQQDLFSEIPCNADAPNKFINHLQISQGRFGEHVHAGLFGGSLTPEVIEKMPWGDVRFIQLDVRDPKTGCFDFIGPITTEIKTVTTGSAHLGRRQCEHLFFEHLRNAYDNLNTITNLAIYELGNIPKKTGKSNKKILAISASDDPNDLAKAYADSITHLTIIPISLLPTLYRLSLSPKSGRFLLQVPESVDSFHSGDRFPLYSSLIQKLKRGELETLFAADRQRFKELSDANKFFEGEPHIGLEKKYAIVQRRDFAEKCTAQIDFGRYIQDNLWLPGADQYCISRFKASDIRELNLALHGGDIIPIGDFPITHIRHSNPELFNEVLLENHPRIIGHSGLDNLFLMREQWSDNYGLFPCQFEEVDYGDDFGGPISKRAWLTPDEYYKRSGQFDMREKKSSRVDSVCDTPF